MNSMRILLVGAMITIVPAGAVAGKVTIPKEGTFQFKFCLAGEERSLAEKDQVYVSHFRVVANTVAEAPGSAFDRMGALCYGIYAKFGTRQQELGVCEMSDLDGDKWWMEFHGAADGSGGIYTAAHGTGKYEGMSLKGQWSNDNWPTASKDGFQGCNPNKGSYKLK